MTQPEQHEDEESVPMAQAEDKDGDDNVEPSPTVEPMQQEDLTIEEPIYSSESPQPSHIAEADSFTESTSPNTQKDTSVVPFSTWHMFHGEVWRLHVDGASINQRVEPEWS